MGTPTYLDFAATTPVDQRVADLVMEHMVSEFGNAGSRTHEYGARASKAVERARAQVAAVVGADPAEVIFTSGATEADNLAILGLADHGTQTGRMHIVASAIEHKAVLEPLAALRRRGFEIDLVHPGSGGAVDPSAVLAAVRADTLLVSVMQINNETGIRQPIAEIAEGLDSAVFFHTDAAQGFGKELQALRCARIDLISMSGHKLYAPKGVGALIGRRRARKRPPLQPLMFGGGQERGLRPGTQPVALIAGLGLAAELAVTENRQRHAGFERVRGQVSEALASLGATLNGSGDICADFIVNASIPHLDSEAAMLALRELISISNGSACTSNSYEPSHVLQAMDLSEGRIRSAIRISWGPTCVIPDSKAIEAAIRASL